MIQSSYLPWKGYFDIIHAVDLFVFYDDVKYTKNDWRNRNVVKMGGGPLWLTIPVAKGAVRQRICDVALRPERWQSRHWQTLRQCYGKCAFFERYAPVLEEFYCRRSWANLSALNQALIRQLCLWLGIRTEFQDSRAFALTGSKQERLLDLLRQVGATHYLSGPSARAYLVPEAFARSGIELEFKEYVYPDYPQGEGPFLHQVSVLDLLFRQGGLSPRYIWGAAGALAERTLAPEACANPTGPS